MKTVVSLQDLIDFEIRPNALLSQYYELTRTSVASFARTSLIHAACPACAGDQSDVAFEKLGLCYRLCRACGSLFVSPRPTEAALTNYYRTSPAAKFWREEIRRETSAMRLEKLIRPRAEWVVNALAEHAPRATNALDVSPGGSALLVELRALWPALSRTTAAHATADLDVDGPGDDIEVLSVDLAGLESVQKTDLVIAFDAIDRAADVGRLVAQAARALTPGGLLFVAAPCASGFDLQVLWDRSPTIMPPDKLNVLSVEGFRRLFSTGRWEILELSTPGMFDVDNVRRAIAANPAGPWPRVIRELTSQSDDTARAEFQEYLQRHRLASFARLVVRRTS
jgi:SAM-dependent methyltransferase